MQLLASLAHLALLADISAGGTPTWTDKEVIVAFGSFLGGAIPVVLFALNFTVRHYRSRTRKILKENERLKGEAEKQEAKLADLREQFELMRKPEGVRPPEIEEILKTLEKAQIEVAQLRTENAESKEQTATLHGHIDRLSGELMVLHDNLKNYQCELSAARNRIKKALRKDGQIWNEKVLSNAPDFKALDPDGRRTPIISVLNLKGGVGKTTVTANLAAAFDGLGYRVLVLDLDLQGSLTGLFLSEDLQEQISGQERWLEDFLNASFGAEFPSLLDYTQPILSAGRSRLVPTTDDLAYAELNLAIRWLLRDGRRDARFLLRRELHLKRVTNNFDIVLLDCPPLINVCCVNALAASDYLLIPVVASKQATARVPILLKRLKEFGENVNPALKVMGILANRTHRSELTVDEQNRLTLLEAQCKDIWGTTVPQFDTFLRQSTEIRQAEDDNRPLHAEDELYKTFIKLAQEVEMRLPTFCRPERTSLHSVQEGVS